jgi:hypothetical protein
MLDAWPLLPIVIIGEDNEKWGVDNIIAALEHKDRIYQFDLWRVPSSQMEKVLVAMKQPIPTLTRMWLRPKPGETSPVVPASFLGGSAPRLRNLWLNYIPFPGLPKLLLSATHLVDLQLRNIPDSGYISPEAIVTSLSSSTRLETLVIKFKSPRSFPDRNSRRPPPLARTPLPVLTVLTFKGVGKYLEDLVARIDAPLLDKLFITFFHQLIFDTPHQLTRFISRTPKLRAHDQARVVFSEEHVGVTLSNLQLRISCRHSDWQLSSLAQVCSLSFPQALIPAVEHLYIQTEDLGMHWQDDIESSQWLELLHPFTAVKGLYISQYFAPRIVPALQELIEEGVTEVLPALQTLFLEETRPPRPVQEGIEQFVAARQLAGHPIAVSRWEREGKGK